MRDNIRRLPIPGASVFSGVRVDVAIPVFNEVHALSGCIEVLHVYLSERLPFDWMITIVDNASTDGTRALAERLASTLPRVRTMALDRKGKGHALRMAWTESAADIVAYMDVDLSTGLDALLPLVACLVDGHSDIAIGSRLAPGARTVRSRKRELISRGYNILLKIVHRTRFADAQCGFKAARASVIQPLLRHVTDDSWFFDTELLLLAVHNGLRVHEIPVDWVEDTDSRVGILSTSSVNFRGVFRIAWAKLRGTARVTGLPARPSPRRIHPNAEVSTGEDVMPPAA
jgi:glycosyltransferase involved in cell wall biosynthesis